MIQLLKIVFYVLALLFSTPLIAQTVIKGVITEKSGEPIPGVNIYVDGTYDGATTDMEGVFSFETEEAGDHQVVATFIGYKKHVTEVKLERNPIQLTIQLQEEINKLDGVTITAGTFEASDEKKSVVLKPLDIAMTAGATADIPGALNTLPGTQKVGESGRLFVRGGASTETRTFVDGMLMNSFYNTSGPNMPGRSRFSPFLFKGTFFSTGGYSAEYGQAMSSALVLNTFDLPEQTESNISLMSVGASASHTERWERGSVFGELAYTNLKPYQSLISQAYDWEKPSESLGGSFMVRQKSGKSGIFKLYGSFANASFALRQPDINNPGGSNRIAIKNGYSYLNATYKNQLGGGWYYSGGVSQTISEDNIDFDADRVDNGEHAWHVKSVFTNDSNEKLTLKLGQEVIVRDFTDNITAAEGQSLINEKTETLPATFAEADVYLSNKFVFRTGARLEYSTLIDSWNLAPRASLAYKTTEFSQVSFAYGRFYQTPDNERFRVTTSLSSEVASHYILNYQIQKDNRTFRIEGYMKAYDRLVKYNGNEPYNPTFFNNKGYGDANGLDIFFRDAKTFRNIDYWVSYSFLDTERDYLTFQSSAVPGFASKHNFSFVYKHFIDAIKSQVGFTYSYGSGRYYTNPNKDGVMNSQLPSYQDFSFNMAYLFRPQVIFYASATNLLGRDNIFGYQFADNPNSDGVFESRAIGQPAKRFLFLGVFITLSKDKSKNQLENL
jgi:hypothetical protein